MPTKRESNYVLKVNSAFIDHDPHLKCYLTFISNDTLCNNIAVPLTITNNSDNKVCTPNYI